MDWPDWIYIVSANVFWAVGFVVSVASRRLGWSSVIVPAFTVCMTLQLVGYLVALAGYCALGEDYAAIGIGISIPRVVFKLVVVLRFQARDFRRRYAYLRTHTHTETITLAH